MPPPPPVVIAPADAGLPPPLPCPPPSIHVSQVGPLHGTIEGWVESSRALGFSSAGVFLPGSGHAGGIATWSIATSSSDGRSGSAYFYSSGLGQVTPTTDVTLVSSAPSVTDIGQITANVMLPWTMDVTPPVLVGEFVVFHDLKTNVYLALRVDAVVGESLPPPCNALAVGSFTYYLQANGSPDFTAFKGM